MTKKLDLKKYCVYREPNGEIVYARWHKSGFIGPNLHSRPMSSFNMVGANVPEGWRTLDSKRHYKVIAQLKQAVKDGKLKVVPVNQVTNPSDFIPAPNQLSFHRQEKSLFDKLLWNKWTWMGLGATIFVYAGYGDVSPIELTVITLGVFFGIIPAFISLFTYFGRKSVAKKLRNFDKSATPIISEEEEEDNEDSQADGLMTMGDDDIMFPED